MRKILTAVVAVIMFALSAAALVPWHTHTTIDGVTYRGTFHFDPPAYLELDTIQWADPSNVSAYYTVPETIEFNGTEFEVRYSEPYVVQSSSYPYKETVKYYDLNIIGDYLPDTIRFDKYGCVNIPQFLKTTVIFPDSMEYIAVEAHHLLNYSASNFTLSLGTRSLTLSDRVERMRSFVSGSWVQTGMEQWAFYGSGQPEYVNFKKIKVIGDKALSGVTIKKIEFEQLDSIGKEALAITFSLSLFVTPELKWLDLHDSPAMLNNACLLGQDSLKFLRTGAFEFNSVDCFGASHSSWYPWQIPLDSLILTRAHRIALDGMSPHMFLEAPCVDTLYEGSFVGGELGNLSRHTLNVQYIDEFAFRDSCIIEVMRFDGLKKIADNAFTNSRIRCFYVNDCLESIGQGIFKFGPEEVVISEGNDRFFTEDDCWFFSHKSPNTPMFHYGPMPTGEWYTPRTKYQGYKVDVSAVENIAINEDFVNIRWRFYNFADSAVNVYINRDLTDCLDIIKLFDGKFEFYVPENLYPDLMSSLGYPPGYPVPYHPYDFSAVKTVDDDTENGPVEYFDLNGLRVDSSRLTPGLYIKRQGAKTEKVILK